MRNIKNYGNNKIVAKCNKKCNDIEVDPTKYTLQEKNTTTNLKNTILFTRIIIDIKSRNKGRNKQKTFGCLRIERITIIIDKKN